MRDPKHDPLFEPITFGPKVMCQPVLAVAAQHRG